MNVTTAIFSASSLFRATGVSPRGPRLSESRTRGVFPFSLAAWAGQPVMKAGGNRESTLRSWTQRIARRVKDTDLKVSARKV